MIRRNLAVRSLAAVLLLGLSLAAAAQSLDIKKATPLKPGENHGTVDSMVGPQFWMFKYKKGDGKVIINFNSMGLFGNPTAATIQIVLHALDGQVYQTRSLTSNGKVATLEIPGNFPGPGGAIVELRPPANTLVRTGGDYSVVVVGSGIDFAAGSAGAAAAGTDPIVGTYAVMVCAPDFDCQGSLSIRFAADGTVQTTDGHSGSWKLFDPDGGVYSLVMGRDRWSLKLVPGRGLFNTTDLSVVVFQAIRPH